MIFISPKTQKVIIDPLKSSEATTKFAPDALLMIAIIIVKDNDMERIVNPIIHLTYVERRCGPLSSFTFMTEGLQKKFKRKMSNVF